MEELLDRLIGIVQETAPYVWAIARRQVVSKIVASAIWATALLFTALLLAHLAKRCNKKRAKDTYGDWGMWMAYSIVGVVLAMIAALGLTTDIVKWLINPDYYAIKLLLGFIKDGG